MEILSNLDILLRLSLAVLLGGVIGTERTLAGKTAGLRTYALASMGSALFVIIAQSVVAGFEGLTNFDPLRVGSQILVGIGFIGAGLVVYRGSRVSGLTSAAALWVSAGIGMACGYGLFIPALIASVLTFVVFTLLWFVEKIFKKISYADDDDEDGVLQK